MISLVICTPTLISTIGDFLRHPPFPTTLPTGTTTQENTQAVALPSERLHRVRRRVLPDIFQPGFRRYKLRGVTGCPPPTVVARAHPVPQAEARESVVDVDGLGRNCRVPRREHGHPRGICPQVTPRLQLVGSRWVPRKGRVLPRQAHGRPGDFDGKRGQGPRGRARRGTNGCLRDRGYAEA